MLTDKQLIAKLQEIENQDLEVLIPNDENSDGNAFIMAGVKQLCIIEAGESDLNDGRYFEDYEGFEVNEGFRLYNKRDFLAIT